MHFFSRHQHVLRRNVVSKFCGSCSACRFSDRTVIRSHLMKVLGRQLVNANGRAPQQVLMTWTCGIWLMWVRSLKTKPKPGLSVSFNKHIMWEYITALLWELICWNTACILPRPQLWADSFGDTFMLLFHKSSFWKRCPGVSLGLSLNFISQLSMTCHAHTYHISLHLHQYPLELFAYAPCLR